MSDRDDNDPQSEGREQSRDGWVNASRRRLLQLLGGGSAAIGLSGTGVAEPTAAEPVREVSRAADIQPAIDALAERDQQGGIVQLETGVYEPATTIWLKKGVTLAGQGGSKANGSSETVLSTASLGDEATFHHNGDHAHPHYPVVANYRTPPLELASREPTDEEEDLWGHEIGLHDLVIDAGEKQRWSEENTYFGVYDATIFSRSDGPQIRNVETRNFLGYGGFYNGCRGVSDKGSRWQGGATDFHCNALTLHTAYPPDPTVYTEGTFDVEVVGPPPTMETFTHDVFFVSEGASRARIEATDPVFLGSEAAYRDGDAPLTDPETINHAYHHDHGHVELEGYTFDGGGQTGGIWNGYNRLHLSECEFVNGSGSAFRQNGRVPATLTDCTVTDYDVGISCESHIPAADSLDLNTDVGVDLPSGHIFQDGSLDDVRFDCSVGVRGTNNSEVILNRPDFSGCETRADPGFEKLIINDPIQNDPVQNPNSLLTIEGVGSYAEYSLTVNGDLAAGDGLGDEDSISGSTATGAVVDGRDTYSFSGDVTAIEIDGGASVHLDRND